MTTIIYDILVEDIIRQSTSLFSSLVVLIKKKDRSWRFYVDYKRLNAIIIKYCLPIPTVNGLLDELHGSSVFSKTDLWSMYKFVWHQGMSTKQCFTLTMGILSF